MRYGKADGNKSYKLELNKQIVIALQTAKIVSAKTNFWLAKLYQSPIYPNRKCLVRGCALNNVLTICSRGIHSHWMGRIPAAKLNNKPEREISNVVFVVVIAVAIDSNAHTKTKKILSHRNKVNWLKCKSNFEQFSNETLCPYLICGTEFLFFSLCVFFLSIIVSPLPAWHNLIVLFRKKLFVVVDAAGKTLLHI